MSGRCATRPGMSLLEVAIVLALLVVIAAMVMPAIGPRFDRQVGIEARTRVRTAINRAQAQASLSGEPSRLLAMGATPQRFVSEPLVLVNPDQPSKDSPRRTSLGELPAACRISAVSTESDLTEPEAFGAPVAEGSPEASVLVGWVLPDGTFEPASGLTLHTPRGDQSLSIDAWTARLTSAAAPGGAG